MASLRDRIYRLTFDMISKQENKIAVDQLAELDRRTHIIQKHFRGETADGQKFVYCPKGVITSWHPVDYREKWCHWCKKYYTEML